MTQLGENIKKFRLLSNLKQEELALKLGKSKMLYPTGKEAIINRMRI